MENASYISYFMHFKIMRVNPDDYIFDIHIGLNFILIASKTAYLQLHNIFHFDIYIINLSNYYQIVISLT